MDIEEIKKYAKNKIEADDLTKQVRRQIKETTWDKQNKREGFTETFKPLISQFEKPDVPKTKNIFTQNQEMLRNQLALTEGLRENQRAITQGFKQFERLADKQELPGVESIEDDGEQTGTEKAKKSPTIYDIEKNFDEGEIKTLSDFGYPRPNEFFDIDPENLQKIYDNVNDYKKKIGNIIGGLKRTKNKTEEQQDQLKQYNLHHVFLNKYKNILNTYLTTLNLQVGQGIMVYLSPQELLNRLELLNGSLVAGNNGVLPEFIQIAHRLRDLGIITNNQLNTLLRKSI